MVSPPRHIYVGHRVYELSLSKKKWTQLKAKQESAHTLLGQCDNERLIIHVNPEQHPIELRETVLHECLHAMWDIMGSREELTRMAEEDERSHEERLVLKQSPRLMEFLLDNPELMDWLLAP